MGAALHSIDSNHPQAVQADRRDTSNIAAFERPAEAMLARAAGQIAHLEAAAAHLEAEVRLLREALARAEHKIRRQDQLLRNAQLRETEIRAQIREMTEQTK